MECVANLRGSRPILLTQRATRRAYYLVARCRPDPPRPGNRRLCRLPPGAAKIFVYRLPRLLCQLEANRSTRLLLTDAGSVKRATIGRDITDAQRNEIAASQLAVDREVEERQIAQAPLELQLGTDRPHVARSQWGSRANNL